MSTALLFDESCLLHLTGDGHPERPSRLEAVRTQLKKDGIWQTAARIDPREATLEELCLVHTPAYVATAMAEIETGVSMLSTGDTHVGGPPSLRAARHAAGGVLNAVDALVSGLHQTVFCAVRPPGHHATPSRGMGFASLTTSRSRRATRSKNTASRRWRSSTGTCTMAMARKMPSTRILPSFSSPVIRLHGTRAAADAMKPAMAEDSALP